MVDDDDVLAEVLDEIELVAGEEHRHPGSRQLLEQPRHGTHRDGIQPGEGFIEDEQVRLVDQGGDELHPLLVAVGQLVHARSRPFRYPQPLEPQVGDPTDLRAGAPAELPQVEQLLPYPHPGVQTPFFRHVPEAGTVGLDDR